MQDQWRGDFVSKAMPFTVPRLISGPDFFPGERESPDPEDGLPLRPTMPPTASLNAFARRAEAQRRADMDRVTGIPQPVVQLYGLHRT